GALALPLPKTLEGSTTSRTAALSAVTGSDRALSAACRPRAALADSSSARPTGCRPDCALARTCCALPCSGATQLLSPLLGPAAEGLARGRPGAITAAIELLLGGRIAVLGAPPVLSPVLPRSAVAARPATSFCLELVDPVPAVHVPAEVVLPLHIDVDVATTPVAAAPDAGTDRHAHAERDHVRPEHVSRRIRVVRRIVRIRPGPICNGRVVARHVNHLRVRRLDLDDGLLTRLPRGRPSRLRRWRGGSVLGDDLLLLVGLQIAIGLRPRAGALGGIHGLLPLTEEGIAELQHPVDLLVH